MSENEITGHRANVGRNLDIWRRYSVYGWTQQRIADEYGLSQPTVHDIIARVRAAIPEPDLAEMRQETVELYRDLLGKAREVVDLVEKGAPVTAGTMGLPVVDPETGNLVRDYAGRLRAIETSLKVAAEARKLMGLDAAAKIDAKVTRSVDSEVEGLVAGMLGGELITDPASDDVES